MSDTDVADPNPLKLYTEPGPEKLRGSWRIRIRNNVHLTEFINTDASRNKFGRNVVRPLRGPVIATLVSIRSANVLNQTPCHDFSQGQTILLCVLLHFSVLM